MHVAVAPARDAARAAHVLRKDAPRLHAAHQVGGEVTVQHTQAILGRHRERGPGRHRLLATTVVEGTGDLALPIQVQRAFLDAAHEQHVAQQLHTVGNAK